MAVMVDIRSVHKKFGALEVLKGIDLQVRAGEVTVVLGPSGSGKSTLPRTINRPYEPREREVLKQRTRIGFVLTAARPGRGDRAAAAGAGGARRQGRRRPPAALRGPAVGNPPRPFRHWRRVAIARALPFRMVFGKVGIL